MRWSRALLTALAAALPVVPSAAASTGAGGDPPLLALGVGFYDIIDADEESADLRVEYRSGLAIWILKPWFGLELTTDGAVYGVGGVLVDFDLGPRWMLTGSAGVGAYEDGDGKDLGHIIEFRTQIEIARRLEQGSRLGFALGHISNAGIGEDNPGTEIFSIYCAIPLKRSRGRATRDRGVRGRAAGTAREDP
ncbi:MAG: acyloxyacyl hydrolase [Gemmatimonadota bacterium]